MPSASTIVPSYMLFLSNILSVTQFTHAQSFMCVSHEDVNGANWRFAPKAQVRANKSTV